jgi:hypothetical protein
MGCLTIVFTIHNDSGKCDEHELLKIIRALDPDIIFEELSESSYDLCYHNMSMHTLEVRALRRYLREKTVPHIPVDNILPPQNFKEEMDLLLDYVENDSIAYLPLIIETRLKTEQFGFGYLVSADFDALSARTQEELEKSVAESNSDQLKRIFWTWIDFLRRREECILSTIFSIFRSAPYRNGILLVGAEHRRPIVEGIMRRVATEPDLITWTVWTGGEPFV